LNPDVGREGKVSVLVNNSIRQRKVVVIGAGTAGLNAALEAKKRGHYVEVFEKENKIGGLLHVASVPIGKERLKYYIDYLEESVKELDLTIHFNEEVTFEKVSDLNPDVVIIATGSRPLIPGGIPGIKNPTVVTAHEVLKGELSIENKNIIVLGGGSIGCETADYLAKTNKVTIIELCNELAREMERINRKALLKRLREQEVNVMLNTRLEEVNLDKVIIREKNIIQEIPADFVVLAVGLTPVLPEWIERIQEIGIDYFVIGDAQTPGKLIDAISRGIAVGRTI
jgi:NADPH-dependent 2,4-dienoyl-CoA reductase/sulfur reductase-like enzyme